MPAVLISVNIVDLIINRCISVLKGDIFLDATGANVAFMANLDATKPRNIRPVSGSGIDIIADPSGPDYYRLSQSSVPPKRRDPKLPGCTDLG